MILTDGEICDKQNTIDAIVKASTFPMSIIIIGVGNSGFGAMEVLDGDKGLLKGTKSTAIRDLVQFVPYR